jgi:hypothetical protein
MQEPDDTAPKTLCIGSAEVGRAQVLAWDSNGQIFQWLRPYIVVQGTIRVLPRTAPDGS